MGIASLLGAFKGPLIGTVQIDVSVRETHRTTAEVSENALETGSDVADHRRVLPAELSMDGVISERPTDLIELVTQESLDGRYLGLQSLVDNADTFTVVTGLRVYKDMVFTLFEVSRDQTTGKIIRFNSTLRQLEFANTDPAQVVVVANDEDAPKAKPKTDTGPKATTPAAASTTANVTSTLSKTGLGSRGIAGGLAVGASDFLGGI
jgi:hypothetical protein